MSKRKRNFQNSLNNFTVPSRQVFSLDSWCPKSAFFAVPGQLFTNSPHAASSGSARTRSHEKCASNPFILDALRAWLGCRWLDESSFRSSSCQMGDDVVARNRWDWKQRWRRECKTEGRLRSYFCFHKQDAKTGRNGCIGTFKKKFPWPTKQKHCCRLEKKKTINSSKTALES